ncbi:acyl-CoA N-acyltransferase [Pleurotus eryngii]|uniref:N-alpha-acetyltransferase 40 n=1 Tax=Pleurotus eryngii TaxID=5323 RepID=A0A9P6DCH9_PLEER|nr:acyl-CoA N-acyltransferase [Pleurotus eryngii]
MSATGSTLVKAANKATAKALSKLVPSEIDTKGNKYTLEVKYASGLLKDEKDTCWEFLTTNMQALQVNYEASPTMGWHPDKKKRELFHRLSRFILAYDNDSALVAYTMFRFEFEEDENLVYCYELQVSPDIKRQGLGRVLMEQVKAIGEKYGMDKIMLTVFKANSEAVQFYERNGFVTDPACPSHDGGDESLEYRILSLEL